MGLRERWRFVVRTMTSDPAPTEDVARFSWLDNAPYSRGGVYGASQNTTLADRVSRMEALQVPAVLRGRNLIAGSLSTLPLNCIDADRVSVRLSLLEQIDPFVPNVVTLAQTFEDLLFESLSWWQITAFGWDGYPSEARHIDIRAVSMTPPPGYPIHTLPSGAFPNGLVWVMGSPVDAAQMIRFDSPNPPLLLHAARAIRRAIKIEQAADRYADDPRPLDYFSPNDGADPADDVTIQGILTDWQVARQTRATGYVPASLKYNTVSVMSPAELQLAELQAKVTLSLANAMGIDAEDLGVSTTSRTYRNAVDRRQDRINETYAAYLRAISDRLSMRDVTPRGKRVVWDLDDFLKADPKSRWETYGIAAGLGAITVDEIRSEEDRPVLTAAQKASMTPKVPVTLPDVPKAVDAPAAPAPDQQMPMPAQGSAMSRPPVRVQLARETGLTFEHDSSATFVVDEHARTISGLAVPFGPTARSGGRSWRFAPGSVKWTNTSRVKLLRDHDHSQALGKAIALTETPDGLMATFRVARGKAGDEALELAADGVLDGLSVGVDFTEDGFAADPTDRSVSLVRSAALREVSLTAMPAFDDSRLTSVAASSSTSDQEFAMECPTCHTVHAAGTPCPTGTVTPPATSSATLSAPAAASLAPVPAQRGEAQVIDATAFTAAVTAFTGAVERLGTMPTEHRQVVPVGQAQVREPLTYSLDGRGYSFVHDAWVARTEYGAVADDAKARLRKYEAQTTELQLAATATAARFANAGNTTDQASIIPPGYRPDLYVGQIPQGRPLFNAMSTGTIANASPFKVPVWAGSSGLSGPNPEGTGPSVGTITNHTFRTVSPAAQSGKFVISRELIDAANPAIDQIALMAMREEYSQDTENVIAAALLAATNSNTGSGQSTQGCYVYAAVGDGADLSEGIDAMWANFPFTRFTVAPDRLLLSQTGWSAAVRAKDSVGRKLFPYIGGEIENVNGSVGRGSQAIDVGGIAAVPAWALTNGTDDAVTFNHIDAWAWESPLLSFRFDEVQGPQNIVLAIWGYFAFQILRYTGINALAYTGA